MPNVPSLYEVCQEKAIDLLQMRFSNGFNPFCNVPSSLVDELLVKVTRRSFTEPLQRSDVKHLLTSDQVTEFILEDVNVNSETLEEILLDLSAACEKLIKIKIRKVYSDIVHRMNLHIKKYAFNCLLRAARNIRYVESCVEFDLYALANSNRLEKLVLNFPPTTSHIYDFLETSDGLKLCNSLKSLEVCQDPSHPIPYYDLAVVLKYCLQLIEINCDIAKTLEYLHMDEFVFGSVNRIYTIQKCRLGSMYEHWGNGAATRDAMKIASLTCPRLEDIWLVVNDDEVIRTLSEFRDLTALVIQWEKEQFGDYALGVRSLLQTIEIGHNLTFLDIINFTNVDFSSIGTCCPNLTSLKVEYDLENNENEFPDTSFRQLQNLSLENTDDEDCEVNTLVGVLSNATDLRSLAIVKAGQLTDEVLQNILSNNNLSSVRKLRLAGCVLSLRGIQILVSSLTALETFNIGLTGLQPREVRRAIRQINPRVIVKCNSDLHV